MKDINTAVRRAAMSTAVVLLAASLSACGIVGGKQKPHTPTLGNRVPILSRIEAGTKVDQAISNVSVVLPPAQVNTEWAQAGGSAAKGSGHFALSSSPRQIWTASIAGSNNKRRLAASPVIGGGMLYAIDTDAMITAFDASTGKRIWTYPFKISGKLKSAAFGGGVSYSDGRVYATNGVGEVASLDAKTGSEYWKVKPAGPLRGSPTIAFNSVYVMTQDNQIHALNAADGSEIWQESSSIGQAGVFGVAAPSAGQGTIIAGYSTGELVAYRYENGRTLWADALARTSISTQVGTLTDVDADPIIDSGWVYALGQGGRMAAYELVTGQRIWELNLAGISTPALAGEWIFTLTDDARLLAIARATGKVRWIQQLREWKSDKKKTNQIFWTGPVLAGNRLWVVNSRGKLVSVDVTDGSVLSEQDIGSNISLAPIVANQILYILDDGGKIHALR
jgi:outer membrane protein assembly factor BamB